MKKIFAILLAIVLCFAGCSEEKIPEQAEFVPERGTVENGVYKNSAFEIGFEAGEDWYFLTDSEIATAMGVAAEEIFGEGAEITGDHIYDLYCVDNKTSATVSINHEDIGTVAEFTDANYYLETVMTQLISSGIENGVVDAIISNIEINGTKVPCLSIVLDYNGSSIYQKIIVKKTGSWMSTVTMASLSEEELDSLVEKISFE